MLWIVREPDLGLGQLTYFMLHGCFMDQQEHHKQEASRCKIMSRTVKKSYPQYCRSTYKSLLCAYVSRTSAYRHSFPGQKNKAKILRVCVECKICDDAAQVMNCVDRIGSPKTRAASIGG